MKQIKTTDLVVGNIFTKVIKLHGRQAFKVEEVPLGKDYIMVTDRNVRNPEPKRMSIAKIPHVILLKD